MRQMARGRRWLAGASSVLCAIALLAGEVPAASAASNGAWSLFPYRAPGASGASRSQFDFSLKAGKSISDAFTLSNDTAHALRFNIYPADAYDVPAGGGFALRGFGQTNVGVGSWIRLPKSVSGIFSLAAGSQVTVPFTVSVPLDASPGDHAGGIVALEVGPATIPKSNVHVSVREGVGVRVYLHILGPVHPRLIVSKVQAGVSVPAMAFLSGSSRAEVRFDVVNTGNTMFPTVEAKAFATNLFGQRVETFRPARLTAVLPGSNETVTEPEWQSLPIAGPITLHVQLLATHVDARYTASFWIVPWVLIVLAAMILAALGTYLLHRRRRSVHGAEQVAE